MSRKMKMFVGFDICKLLKEVCDKTLKPPYADKHDDEEQWRKAYDKGINDTMDCLKQLIEVALIDDTNCCSYVVAHVPNLTTMTEFDSLEAITTRNRYNAIFDKEPQ